MSRLPERSLARGAAVRLGSGLLFGLLAAGCGGQVEPLDEAVGAGPTYHRDVAPLLVERCGACHRSEGIAPFAVDTYAEAAPWGAAMVDAVRAGRMPPFAAAITEECEPEVWFRDDHRLTPEELARLEDWVEAGTPEGDPAEAPAQVEPDIDVLQDPQAVVSLPEPFTVEAGGRDIYQCFRVEVPHDTDIYVTGVQVLPDNEAVVHHVLVWNDPLDQSAGKVGTDGSYPCSGEPDVWPTELLAAWTPGGSPTRSPEGTGSLVKAGATLVVNVHYHPTKDTTEVDRTSIALEWTTDKPANFTTWYLVDIPFGAQVQPGPADEGSPEFLIPAGASDHTETVLLDTGAYLPWELPIFAITPHMHYLGTEMLVTIRRDDPAADECLIHTPTYRFDFQTSYVYDAALDELPILGPGDKVEVRCTYDNSSSNPFIEDALEASGAASPVDVGWGEDTGDEMCMAMVGLVIPPIDLSEYL